MMDYIRDHYNVPAKRGGRVIVLDLKGEKTRFKGTITSATHYVFVRLDGKKHPKRYHPNTLFYCDGKNI